MLAVVSLTFGLFIFFITAAVLSGKNKSAGNVTSRLEQIKSLDDEDKPKKKVAIDFQKLTASLFGSNKKKKKPAEPKKMSKSNEKLDKMLQLAGFNVSAQQYNFLKYVSVISATLLTYYICAKRDMPQKNILLAVGGVFAVVLFFFSNAVSSKVAKKKEAIQRDLPDIIDLLVVSVEAGLGFDAALNRLYQKNKCDMMEELIRTQQDIHHGVSKKDAYDALKYRCDSKEVTSFANAIVQSEQMGISMKTVLSSQSETLREERKNRAREKAEKAPIKMMIPMVVFIFPTIFIILLAPAAVNIIEVLG